MLECIRYNFKSYQFTFAKIVVEKWSQLPLIFSGHREFLFEQQVNLNVMINWLP
jgi:hypothetical protein